MAHHLPLNYDLTNTSTMYAHYCLAGCQHGVPNINAIMAQLGGNPNKLFIARCREE